MSQVVTVLPNKVKEFERLLKESTKLVVVDYSAKWCGPCKKIAPEFDVLSKKYNTVIFLKVDIDALPAVAEKESISTIPTFVLYKNGKKVGKVGGANIVAVETAIKKFLI